jgi:putative heme transporter
MTRAVGRSGQPLAVSGGAEEGRGRRRRRLLRKIILAGISAGIVVATFAYFLPSIANYGAVWEIVKTLSWPQIGALIGATVLNLVTFAPPWMITLSGLSFLRAMQMTQASTALSIVLPGGAAVGAAGSIAMLRVWGFRASEIARAVTLTSVWNQFLNLLFPIVAVFLLTITGNQTAALATAAFIGVAVLGVVGGAFVLVLVSDRLANDVGDAIARLTNWTLRKIRRRPVSWGGESFSRFRRDAGDFLQKRWHVLTLAALAGSLTVFGVLLVSLRALGVSGAQVSVVEAFAAWALVRLVASIPITPGGIGIVELGLTGTLVGFGGHNARVVAAVLVYRFLTVVPTLVLGLVGAFTWRRGQRRPEPVELIANS